jgi:hypothetical protein
MFLVVLFVAMMTFTGMVVFQSATWGYTASERLHLFGCIVFVYTFGLEVLLLSFFIPNVVAAAVAEERERDTLPLLLLTRLRPIEIVVTKTTGRWLAAIGPSLAGLPVLVVAGVIAGLERELVLALIVVLSTSVLAATLAIWASAVATQTASAKGAAAAWVFGWLFGPPMVSFVPVRGSSLWGGLISELKVLCALIAPSSPLSLLTDRGWFFQPGFAGLTEQVALMVGLQSLFGLIALLFAASRLKARETNPNWTDPTRGYRPPCGDDPIYWREYELPARRGGASAVTLRLRYLMILIRAMWMTALAMLVTLIALAIPVALVAATTYYGVPAFRELAQYGYGLSGPFVERQRFNWVVRAATAVLGLFPSLTLAAVVQARITSEHAKQTWEPLLMTPLSGAEILRSKARVMLDIFLQLARALPIVWVLGLVCGVVSPLGILAAAASLALVLWANLAHGLSLGIRPGPPSVAANRASLGTLLSFILYAPFVTALLASPRELAVFATWDVRIRWGLVLLGVVVLVATGAFAWKLTRQMLRRFDEWVGRPCKEMPTG